jgi:predicted acylesterase/phospholipase RssA
MSDESTRQAQAPHTMPLCDMVMEGGVTSGVIYPKAVVELAQTFRLKNIGGSSVGALAAAVAAAAEVGRARDPLADPGYKRLASLPEELQGPGFSRPNVTRLFDLFQPQAATRPLFNVLASGLNLKGKELFVKLLLATIPNFPLVFAATVAGLLAVLFFLGVEGIASWIVAVLFSVVCGIGAVALAIWRIVSGPLLAYGFGLCTGYVPGSERSFAPRDRREPLTLWLARLVNECAGKAADGEPLTFGELWDPTGDERSQPPAWLQAAGTMSWRYVELQVMTTNVTHGRPYRFPNEDKDQALFFRPKELAAWFPPNVVRHMVDKAADYDAERHEALPHALPEGMLMLPRSRDLPVVFAARLSLSFPFLLSAIPLYAVDFEQQVFAKRSFERCWFSDGGICSNFPIHLFDAPLPLWPTFGVKLEAERKHHPIDAKPEDKENRWFLPDRNDEGRGDSFLRFDEQPGVARLAGFALGILNAARHWQNNMLVRAPGVRDRVLRVYLKKDEGGLNLNMRPAVLADLTRAGAQGGAMLATQFAPGSTHWMNFDNHRSVRLQTLTGVLEKDVQGFHRALAAAVPGAVPWPQLVPQFVQDAPAGVRVPDPAAAERERKMAALVGQLRALSLVAAASPDLLRDKAPRRAPVIRIVPDI